MNTGFEFTPENQRRFERILKRYPVKRAAMLPTLHLAHEQLGYITPEAEAYVSQLLEVPVVDVHEVLTFYTLYFQQPMGQHHIRLCMSISCWIRGATHIKSYLEEKLGVKSGGVTEDQRLSWEAVPDCLGACEFAPMMQLDKGYHGPLTSARIDEILDDFSASTLDSHPNSNA